MRFSNQRKFSFSSIGILVGLIFFFNALRLETFFYSGI
ncbi:hypothetical protein LEP1GSC036_3054 [Leptospira weilii str. 2006001853]|uniref:Uncharacterized protein n=1 Tax=Leptospira weilii str. 2006001853 TaxID=1001589 RepID=A0A828YZE7_9LEPT|nr:hypothetical protein LEP1GSC036_3054 [Leptospira weilii str. 2006001853]